MCEFCIKHGEGKKWYEVMEHYSMELLSQKNREEYIKNFLSNIQRTANPTMAKLELAKRKVPFAYRFIRKLGADRMKKLHFGQVVPLEDAQKIVEMVHSITRIPCVCRKVTTGRDSARYCLVLGIDPAGLFGDFPDLKNSLETLTSAKARELLGEFDKKGLVHSIWTFKTPYIGAICNCDRDCLAYRVQITKDLMQVMFKGEYIAVTDPLQCTGCRACRKICQFGAVEYSVMNSKCYINPDKCFGCGICRSACPVDAITLTDREPDNYNILNQGG